MYFTYVLYSKQNDRIYVGQTNDIDIRLEKRNAGKVKSTKAYIPWRLLICESFDTRAKAMRRESELKSHKGRDYIRGLIGSVGGVRQMPD
jgi:putative endonuclease